ncbi:MAG TPA: TIGR00269 family protein [Thermoplasmata archaeon]|nr:TIGR00269 family protein [Thermoplasmata archaeon]
MACDKCGAPAAAWIRYSGAHLCREHFLLFVEKRVREELRREVDLKPGTRIAIGLSGGKDSSTATTLLHEIVASRKDVELLAITVDEGIASYRPEGLAIARDLCANLGIEHRVISYRQTVGFEMDAVVKLDGDAIPCGYCGVFRRQALNRAARDVGADYVATGLNLDDTAQSILMNVARGDVDRLARLGPHDRAQPGLIPRLQPLRMIPEKEVYLYAMLRGIRFHDATCPYAERAQRGKFSAIVAQLEEAAPGTRHAIVSTYDQLRPMLVERFVTDAPSMCVRCGEPASEELCKACELAGRLEKLAA